MSHYMLGTTADSVGQPTAKSDEQPTTRSVGQPTARSVGQPAVRSVGQPTARSVEQPTACSVGGRLPASSGSRLRSAASRSVRFSASKSRRPTVSGSQRPTVSGSQRPSVSGSQRPSVLEGRRPTVSESQRPSVSGSRQPTMSGSRRSEVLVALTPHIRTHFLSSADNGCLKTIYNNCEKKCHPPTQLENKLLHSHYKWYCYRLNFPLIKKIYDKDSIIKNSFSWLQMIFDVTVCVIACEHTYIPSRNKNVKSSMARSLPVENLLPQNVGSIINYLQ